LDRWTRVFEQLMGNLLRWAGFPAFRCIESLYDDLIFMRASVRTPFESGGPRRGTHLSFACPEERWIRKGHPANATFGCSAHLVPHRRSPTRYAQTRLAFLLSGIAMLDASEWSFVGEFHVC
jgi:hypothetical protein